MFGRKNKSIKWSVQAENAGLAVFPTSTPEKPPRDGACIGWEKIEKVVAYKRDMFVTDLVCMNFITASGNGFEIDEELQGFHETIKVLPSYLPGFPEPDSYWGKLVTPAFATNEMALWQK